MIEHSLSFSEIPQSIVDMARKRFEADPQIRFMRIQQNMCVREHNIHKAMDIGAEIENLFARVMQTYLEDSEDESEVLNLTEQQFPEKDRRELMEIVLTLFLATDIIDTATMDFNDVLLESHALDITGVRRCGKSTIMRQRMRGSDEPWFYVNFESPLLTQFELRDTIRLDSLIDKSGAKM